MEVKLCLFVFIAMLLWFLLYFIFGSVVYAFSRYFPGSGNSLHWIYGLLKSATRFAGKFVLVDDAQI